MKPVFSTLRKKGQANVSYIDDSLVVSRTKAECVDNIHETVQLLDSLGLIVHLEKSVLRPTKCIKFLGFWIDSVEMKITLTNEKAKAIVLLGNEILQKELVVIRKLAQLIGNLVASELGVNYAPLYYKVLEIDQRLSRACIVHLVIKKTNWSYVKTMSCSGSHLKITINIKNTKFVKDLPMIDAQFRFNQCNSFREEYISVFSPYGSVLIL